MNQTPSVGRVVLVSDSPFNGVTEHPAIVNRVWSPTLVNVTVFPDCGSPYCKTSVLLSDDESAEKPGHWRWPPRT